jgi:hypothetical protein
MTQENPQRFVVTVDEEHLANMVGIAESLRTAGMQVKELLPTLGIIIGEVAEPMLSSCRQVPGVMSIERDEEMRAT